MCQSSKNLEHFQFWDQLGLTGSKYFRKIIFDIKIEINILEILDMANFDKF